MRSKIETFSSVLIANRGEIACRIIKTAKKCGLRAIGVYTKVDQDSLHVKLADQSILIGDGPIAESYLSIPKIINAALALKVEAIHPGYGFLSENADFATACKKNGLLFVGPKPKSIKIMGNKAEAKKVVSAAGFQCIPGYELNEETNNEISFLGNEVGYPLMIKASSGGGGKGMRLVNREEELHKELKIAQAEALNSFGSNEIIFERAIKNARHVEIQIFGDTLGNVIHLGERDCSIQRRHQKIFEEAPCPNMSKKLRHEMGETAVKIAKEINYIGAGTIEFLLDSNNDFYFLEMNTRLQVEHPVTELVTGLDLVYLQFLVADGQSLPIKQNEVVLKGHAIETRLYAEDPANNFLPSSGPLKSWVIQRSKGVRIDNGYCPGNVVTPFYDPMLAKIIGYGATRKQALRNLTCALENASIFGIQTNRSFLLEVLKQDQFLNGSAKTTFLEDIYPNGFSDKSASSTEYALVAAFIYKNKLEQQVPTLQNMQNELVGWSNRGRIKSTLLIKHLEKEKKVDVTYLENNKFLVGYDNNKLEVLLSEGETRVNGRLISPLSFNKSENTYQIINSESEFYFVEINQTDKIDQVVYTGTMRAPMHGVITDIFVTTGQRVKIGDCLIILEAMKMQHELVARVDGFVNKITTSSGKQVSIDDILIEIKPNE
tara:strand:- start:5770 stop:7752 length:1983 start_codon:yes stop_codon:yes gene_type:complete